MTEKTTSGGRHKYFFGERSSSGMKDGYIKTVVEGKIEIGRRVLYKIFGTETLPDGDFIGFGCSFPGCSFILPDTGRNVHSEFGVHNVTCHAGETMEIRMVSLFEVKEGANIIK